MSEELLYILGQIVSIIAVILGFLSFQMKTARRILGLQIIVALLFALHYLLIGGYSAIAPNLLGCIGCIFFYWRDKTGSNSLVIPVIFITLLVIMGIITWAGWYDIFILTGCIASNAGLSMRNPQNTRKAMLIKSPLCLIYNAIVLSIGGVIYEISVLSSSIIGLIRNRKKK